MKKLCCIVALLLTFIAPALAQVNPGTSPLSIAKGGTAANTRAGAAANILPAFTGDVTSSLGGSVLTLAGVNSNVGSFGSATQCVSFTTNAKGLITAASAVPCTPAVASITGLGTGVAASLGLGMNTSGGMVGPVPTRAGDVIYWSGTAWVTLAGNNSGTQVLEETSAGVPSWATVSGTGTVTSVTCNAGLTGGTFTTTGTCAVDPTYVPNHLGGLTLSNDGTAPNSVLDIAAGAANDSTNAVLIKIGAFTKSTQGAWAPGSGSNGMGNGLTIANSTGYHVCLAYNGGTPDIWFDTSAVCADKPAGVSGSLFRRVGSFRTGASALILAYTQHGDYVTWAAPILELSTTTPSTSLTALSLVGVPQGISSTALLRGILNTTAAANDALIASGDETAVLDATTGNRSVVVDAASTANAYQVMAVTNASNQIKYQVSTGTALAFSINTFGYIDTRGK
jgi:hypothetical protein